MKKIISGIIITLGLSQAAFCNTIYFNLAGDSSKGEMNAVQITKANQPVWHHGNIADMSRDLTEYTKDSEPFEISIGNTYAQGEVYVPLITGNCVYHSQAPISLTCDNQEILDRFQWHNFETSKKFDKNL